jgi:hypothetical protein
MVGRQMESTHVICASPLASLDDSCGSSFRFLFGLYGESILWLGRGPVILTLLLPGCFMGCIDDGVNFFIHSVYQVCVLISVVSVCR